jgi:hypothetical protein
MLSWYNHGCSGFNRLHTLSFIIILKGGVTMGAGIGSTISTIVTAMDLGAALDAMALAIGGIMTVVIPAGIGITLIMSLPRIVRRVIGAFI